MRFIIMALALMAMFSTASAQVREDCSFNLERHESQHNTDDFSKFSGGSTLYEDPDFPAAESSLFWRAHLRDSEMPQRYIDELTGWARPSELVKDGAPSLWGSQGVKPAGTNQGQLGDCWFLASCAALAEWPDRIHKIFTNTDYDSAGIFQMNFYHFLGEVNVVVDDRLPISEGMDPRYTNFGVKTPLSTKVSKNGAWWQPILEKAFAKFNVNYSQLNGGIPGVAFRELTHMPVANYDSQDQTEDEFFDIVNQADKNNWAMAAACEHEHASLITGHAYTLLGARKLSNGVRLVQLRNPWGAEEYTGPYNDHDSQWTDALKKEVGLTSENDGIFYMPVEDFKIAFTTYAVSMYDDWLVARHTGAGTGQVFSFTFESASAQDVILNFEYQHERQIAAGCPQDNVFYNLYVDNGAPIAVSTQTGYAFHRMKVEAGKKHTLDVYNWEDTTVESNFVLTAYSANSKIEWEGGRRARRGRLLESVENEDVEEHEVGKGVYDGWNHMRMFETQERLKTCAGNFAFTSDLKFLAKKWNINHHDCSSVEISFDFIKVGSWTSEDTAKFTVKHIESESGETKNQVFHINKIQKRKGKKVRTARCFGQQVTIIPVTAKTRHLNSRDLNIEFEVSDSMVNNPDKYYAVSELNWDATCKDKVFPNFDADPNKKMAEDIIYNIDY